MIAAILGVIAFFRTCSQENRIESIQTLEAAVQHRPILDIVKHTFHISKYDSVSFVNDVGSIGLEVAGIILKGVIVFHNSGTSYAKIIFHCTCDSLSGKPILRDNILSGADLKKFQVDEQDNFFSIMNIKPGKDDSETVFVNLLTHGSNGSIHILLVYENELGMLYDTYYWIKYDVTLPDFELRNVRKSNDTTYVGLPKGFVFKNFIHTEATNQDPKIYSSDESKIARDFFSALKFREVHAENKGH